MRRVRHVNTSAILAGKLVLATMLGGGAASANDFTAEKVMKSMSSAERTAYLAGVVEGLAIARYMKDGKQKKGMECIYDWFYEDKTTMRTIHEAFEKFAAYPPGSIIDVLVKRKCGE